MTSTDARGDEVTYTLDALNRVTKQAYGDETIVFGYDNPAKGANGIGRLTSASDAYHALSWTYDDLGRVSGKGQTVAGVTKSVGYGYSNGDLVNLVTPSGQNVVYSYTNRQITGITVNGTTLLSGVTYFPYGGVSGWTWGNGTTVARTYDQDGNITSITTAADTLDFVYDNAFRITRITDTGTGTNTWSLPTYDLLDRLQSATKSGASYGWTYDANGNRLTQTGTSANSLTLVTNSNELTTTTGALVRTYAYDAAGNTSSYGTLTFTFNDRGRMSAATNGSTSASYTYDALGQLIEKSVSGTKTLLMYDEQGHLLGEYTSTGALIQETIWMGDVPVATLRPNGSSECTTAPICVFYVHTDQLNAPRKITNPATNALVWRWDADPFGTASSNQNPSGLGTFIYNLRFPGQYQQVETGLNYNYYRDYDPKTGRYVESDPIGLRAGVNTYAYVGGNPVSYTDSSGLCPDEDKCKKLLDQMDNLVNSIRPGDDPTKYKGLAQRFRQIPNLLKYAPSEVPGHLKEIDNRQRELQKVLQDYIDSGCGGPPGYARDYAFRAIPGNDNAALSVPSLDPQTQQQLEKGVVTAGAGGLLLLIIGALATN